MDTNLNGPTTDSDSNSFLQRKEQRCRRVDRNRNILDDESNGDAVTFLEGINKLKEIL